MHFISAVEVTVQASSSWPLLVGGFWTALLPGRFVTEGVPAIRRDIVGVSWKESIASVFGTPYRFLARTLSDNDGWRFGGWHPFHLYDNHRITVHGHPVSSFLSLCYRMLLQMALERRIATQMQHLLSGGFGMQPEEEELPVPPVCRESDFYTFVPLDPTTMECGAPPAVSWPPPVSCCASHCPHCPPR